MGWKAPQLVDYAASLGCDSLFITDFDAFESMDDAALQAIRQQAAAKQLQIQLGTWSIDPTSKASSSLTVPTLSKRPPISSTCC